MSPFQLWSMKIEQAEDLTDIDYCLKGIAEDHELSGPSKQTLEMACRLQADYLRHHHAELSPPRKEKNTPPADRGNPSAGPFSDAHGDGGRESGGVSREDDRGDTSPSGPKSPAAAKPPAPSRVGEVFGPGYVDEASEAPNMSDKEKDEGGSGNEWLSKGIMETSLAKVRKQADAADRTAEAALAHIPERAMTVQAIEQMADLAIARVKAFERVKNAILREGHHYVVVCKHHPQDKGKPYVPHEKRLGGADCGYGQVMMKKNGADALGNGFGVSVFLLSDLIEKDKDGAPLKAVVETRADWQGMSRFGRGTCLMAELQGEKTEHNMHEKAQTRSEKRSILAVLGSADPIADEE